MVLGLSLRRSSANSDDGQFIPADPAIQNLFSSSSRVEKPFSVCVFLQRDSKGKIISTHEKELAAVGHLTPSVHHSIPGHESVDSLFVLHRIAGRNQVFRIRTENRQRRCSTIARLCTRDQRVGRVVWRRKLADRWLA